jgi:molybdate transport system ATP-binding protein
MVAGQRGHELVMSGTVQRGSFTVGADLVAAPGEVLAVLGPNGAGKSTLLRALSGLDALSSGSIRLGGLILDDAATDTFVPAARRPVGLVFQDYRLFPHLDVRDNVAYAPRVQGSGRRAARAAADMWLQRLDLTSLATRHPHEISGGQAQKVARPEHWRPSPPSCSWTNHCPRWMPGHVWTCARNSAATSTSSPGRS